MKTETISYKVDGVEHRSFLAYEPDFPTPKPLVLIFPTWEGVNHFAKNKAQEIASLGFAALAVDVYGEGKTAPPRDDEAGRLMLPLYIDRALLRSKIHGAYTHAAKLPGVDPRRAAAMGFCFGGLAVIELLKAGIQLRGCISIHPSLMEEMAGQKPKHAPVTPSIEGSLLILHGMKDPLAPFETLMNLEKQLSAHPIDWQIHIFGRAGHAFTNPEADDFENGLYYDASSNRRSTQLIKNFLTERLL